MFFHEDSHMNNENIYLKISLLISAVCYTEEYSGESQ